MKKYDVTLTGHYEKTISVYADSPEQAAEKVKIILFDTDLIEFSDEDFSCGEADIAEADECEEDGCEENADEDEEMEDACCSDCPYLRRVMSYQALNLVIHLPMDAQIRLSGGCP